MNKYSKSTATSRALLNHLESWHPGDFTELKKSFVLCLMANRHLCGEAAKQDYAAQNLALLLGFAGGAKRRICPSTYKELEKAIFEYPSEHLEQSDAPLVHFLFTHDDGGFDLLLNRCGMAVSLDERERNFDTETLRDLWGRVVVDAEEILSMQREVANLAVNIDRSFVASYPVTLSRALRPGTQEFERAHGSKAYYLRGKIASAPGPRTTRDLILLAAANAILNDKSTVDLGDLKHVYERVLRHRLIGNYRCGVDMVELIRTTGEAVFQQ